MMVPNKNLMLLAILFFFSGNIFTNTYAKVFYWSNANCGLGHISVAFYGVIKKKYSSYNYLSFAMGNDYRRDKKYYGEPTKIIDMPLISAKKFNYFRDWYKRSIYSQPWNSRYYDSYDFVFKNCALASSKALEKFGYDLNLSYWDRRVPKLVYRAVRKMFK